MLDEARQQYDYIVMDTPPLAPVQDCRVVARWVDGIVLVVAADHTPRALLEAALDTLEPNKVLGLVFNGYDHLFSRRHAQSLRRLLCGAGRPEGGRRALPCHEEGRRPVQPRQRCRGKESAGPGRVAVSLAVIEGLVLFLAVCGSIYAWGHVLFVDWLDVAKMLGQAGAVSLCCIVAFYYNDLYDLRVVRSFSLFASRLLQSFGVALILLAGFFLLFPEANIDRGPLRLQPARERGAPRPAARRRLHDHAAEGLRGSRAGPRHGTSRSARSSRRSSRGRTSAMPSAAWSRRAMASTRPVFPTRSSGRSSGSTRSSTR